MHTIVFHIIGLAKKVQKATGFKSSVSPLSYSQAASLLVIESQKDISQQELASRIHLEPATIVNLIDELEKLKLVKRELLSGNRRKYRIVLTQLGEAKVEQIRGQTKKLENFLRNSLGAKESEKFYSTIEKLYNYLDHWKGGE